MKLRLLTLLACFTLTFTACKEKDKSYTLTVVSGNNQSGEVNSLLPEPIVVQLLRGDEEIGYKSIKFESSTGQTITKTTDENGKASFDWQLNCGVGPQFATITALEPGTSIANTIANASSQIPAIGYFKPCGLPSNIMFYRFIFASSTGKLFTANTTLYASDDGGYNWYEVSGPPSVLSMLQIGNNLITLGLNGIYRSTNEGISWTQLTPMAASAFTQTPTHWFASNAQGDIYESHDQGLNWALAKGQNMGTGINFLFTNSNNQVIGLSPNSAYTILQDSVIKHRTLNNNTLGAIVGNKTYFGTEGYVYAVTDTAFQAASIDWGFSTEVSESKNLKQINGNLYVSQFNSIYQKGLSGKYYQNANLTGKILDYVINPNGTKIVSHESQGIYVIP